MPSESSVDPAHVELDLLGLPTICWKCGTESVSLVAVVPHVDASPDQLVRLNDPAALALAAQLLPSGTPRVGTIKERASRTAGETYLSNGCMGCDALFGNVFLFHEELLEVLVTEGIEGLEVLASVSAPAQAWNALQGGSETG